MEENHKAIEAIQALVTASQEVHGDIAGRAMVLPGNTTLKDFEPLLPGRFRYRAQFTTSAMDDFVDYLETRVDEGEDFGSALIAMIDSDRLSARVRFNLGNSMNPGHGDDTADLATRKLEAYRQLESIDGNHMSQRDMAEWLEDWADYIVPISSTDEAYTVSQAIAVIRAITLEEARSAETKVEDFGESRSTLASVNAKSSTGRPLPWGFEFNCQPSTDLNMRPFQLRLRMLTSRDEPVFVLRWGMRARDEELISEEFKELLISKIIDRVASVRLFTGSMTI
jgi:uncharacterized protein YfdQ (DUF2303 family)